jgi:hypothetical protein
MIAPLDVFVMIGDNDYQLLGCAGTLHEALELIEKTGPGAYLLFSETTRHKNTTKWAQKVASLSLPAMKAAVNCPCNSPCSGANELTLCSVGSFLPGRLFVKVESKPGD